MPTGQPGCSNSDGRLHCGKPFDHEVVDILDIVDIVDVVDIVDIVDIVDVVDILDILDILDIVDIVEGQGAKGDDDVGGEEDEDSVR